MDYLNKPSEVDDLIQRLFAASENIRYVALNVRGKVTSRQREGVEDASASVSDFYEEAIVNPTLLTLVGRRGEIDCGGLYFCVVRYGHFYQIVMPIEGGHISIAVESSCDPIAVQQSIAAEMKMDFVPAVSKM